MPDIGHMKDIGLGNERFLHSGLLARKQKLEFVDE